jgi:citrate lyase beta subunit
VGLAFVEGAKNGTLPQRFGIRPKAFAPGTIARALRTLDLFFSSVKDAGGSFDAPFVITLPKVERAEEVRALADIVATVARTFAVPRERFQIEVLIETPRALFDESGRVAVRGLVDAGQGLVESVHLGAYDLLSSVDVPARASTLAHPTLGTVRAILQLALAGTGVAVVDGATTILPTGVHKAKKGASLTPREESENRVAIAHALKLHAAHVTRALDVGITRGWDLHPGQVLARRVAAVAHSVREIDAVLDRLKAFLDARAQAMRTGSVFDDAASALGLVNTVLQAARIGVVDDEALRPLGLTTADLRTRTFAEIVQSVADQNAVVVESETR